MNGMLTKRGEALLARREKDPGDRPWEVYPRPRMVRAGWINLNGPWDFGANATGEPVWDRSILVPFPPESALSGVEGFDAKKTPCLYYRKRFVLEELPAGKRLLLHIGGADQELTELRFNGETVLEEYNPLLEGPLSLELRNFLPGENVLELAVTDRGGTELPWGKQRDKRGGMWYTPISGLWQTVWLEWVPETYISELRVTPTLEYATVEIQVCRDKHCLSADDMGPSDNADGRVPSLQGEIKVLFEGKEWPAEGGKAVLRPEHPRLWTPEDPYLYEFTVLCGEDRVSSYFALRTVETGVVDGIPRLLLNGKPYFFNGLLDQGYWSDGLWTPADPACFADDLQLVKRLGFNMVRKHIKIEPELFYYECDRLGVAVFQDLINLGPYNYLRDTVLPTIRIQRVPHLFRSRSRRRAGIFSRHLQAAVGSLYSHPSVVYWTVFNEGWGQQYTTRFYEEIKALDPTRIVDTASGWFRIGKTDVDSRHVYFRAFKMPKRMGGRHPSTGLEAGPPPLRAGEVLSAPTAKPVVLSEFGGYVWKIKDHSFNREETYGYKIFEKREDWEAAFRALYREQIEPAVPQGLCAAVYTQLSDVEDETNGLVTYDRRVVKLKVEN